MRVLLVATVGEAVRLGANRRGELPDGSRAISVLQTRQLAGLRATEWDATDAAREHPAYPKMAATLDCLVAKFVKRCADCGKPKDSFACKIRHLQLNTGAAKAARD